MTRKYLSWMIRGAFTLTPAGKKKPCSMLDKAVLEGDPTGDAKEIISYLRHLQCA